MASNVWEDIIEHIEEQVRDIERALGKGGPADYPTYREEVGRIRGLRSAIHVLEDLQRKYMDDHNE